MRGRRSYRGDPIDASWQYFHERPAAQEDDDGETVYATAPEPDGEETTEDVPVPDGGGPDPSEGDRQTTLDEWGWSP